MLRAERNGRGAVLGVAHTRRTSTAQRTADSALAYQALHDRLTGLPNRELLRTRLRQALTIALGNAPSAALLLLDLDRFKEVNLTLGHPVGDALLQQIGLRLRGVVRTADVVARLGADEFAVLLLDTDADGAAQAAEGLAQVLQAPFLLEGQPIVVDASIGIAVAPEHGQDADTLLRCADVAMDQAKRAGTGVALYSAAADFHSANRLALLGELRHAIDHDQLLLHYQPTLNLRDGTLVGFEALVRWQHPQRGFLPPSEFIPLAEQTGLIYPLSHWVLEAALKQHQVWRAAGIDVPVSINLSRRMLHDPRLPETIAELLVRWNALPSAIVLEITESSLMADSLRTADCLRQLQGLGVHISIDDFGTGYSSLASLKDLSVDELKIDQSFVQAMATNASCRAIVRAIIDLADALNLRVVAEGVEDRATWDVLAGLGCDVAQGYFISRPIAADELAAWVAKLSPSQLAITDRPGLDDALQERIRGRGARLAAEEEFIARKQAEAALRASEERNRRALQAARMGTWDLDAVHNVHTWSPETEALFGLAPGTFAGSLANFWKAVHPDDRMALSTEWNSALAERCDFNVSYRTIWPDGSTRWIEDKGRAIHAADGTLIRVTGTSMDITQRKQGEAERKLAEEALRASEELFRNQYKGFPLPTYSWLQVGDDFVLQDFNDAAEAVTEGRIRVALGSRASAWYADQPGILAHLEACRATQDRLRLETTYRYRTTGLERQLALTFVFVPPHTVMIHAEDVTEARQVEHQREATAQSEKLRALGQMASGIAHEINQSLMLVASYGDLARQALMHEPQNLDEIHDLLTTTSQAALDGGETVKRLLSFTRNTAEHDSQVIDLGSIVRETAQLTAPRWRDTAQAEGRPISLHVEAVGRATVQGSPAQLREVMTNLIFNAVDALPSGGTIHLRVVSQYGQGVIEVSDSGVGMSAEIQKRMFEPFFTTKAESGSGLGLAVVFGIVERHGGGIDVRSTPGEGTTFRISLPLVTVVASEDALPPPTQASTPRPLRVLAVDDEPMMTMAVQRMIRPSGYLVTVAGSGEEALEKLSTQTFDVVVSDMGMGAGMNGWELAEAVRTGWPTVRFLLATGWGPAIDPHEAESKGIEAILSKPYRPDDLLRALARPGPPARG